MKKENTQNLPTHVQGTKANGTIEKQARNFFYPDSEVYKNKYNITAQEEYYEAYARDVKEAIDKLHDESFPERFDTNYLRQVHKLIFSNLFEWAGQTRDEPFRFKDGTIASQASLPQGMINAPFAKNSRDIQEGLKRLDMMNLRSEDLQSARHDDFIQRTAAAIAHLKMLHPFKDGNSEVIEFFSKKMARAAGYNLDYSFISEKRWEDALVQLNNGSLKPLMHIVEDASNPKKCMLLAECQEEMGKIGLDVQKYITAAAQEGCHYEGTYRGSGPKGLMIGVGEQLILANKEDLALKTENLKIGDKISFTVPSPKDVRKVLIPGSDIPFLTNEGLTKLVQSSIGVKSQLEEVQRLSQIVYGKENIVQKKLPNLEVPITDEDLGQVESFVQRIRENPKTICKLRGMSILGHKSSARQRALEHVDSLCESIIHYAKSSQNSEKFVLEQHYSGDMYLGRGLEAPSKQLKNLARLSTQDEIKKVLSKFPELRMELDQFFQTAFVYLPEDLRRMAERGYHQGVAQGLQISTDQARELVSCYRDLTYPYNILRRVNRALVKQRELEKTQQQNPDAQKLMASNENKQSVEASKVQTEAEGVAQSILGAFSPSLKDLASLSTQDDVKQALLKSYDLRYSLDSFFQNVFKLTIDQRKMLEGGDCQGLSASLDIPMDKAEGVVSSYQALVNPYRILAKVNNALAAQRKLERKQQQELEKQKLMASNENKQSVEASTEQTKTEEVVRSIETSNVIEKPIWKSRVRSVSM